MPPYRGTEYFMLDFHLTPQPCTKEEWLRWVLWTIREMAYTKVEGVTGVRTEFPGFRNSNNDGLFRTCSYGPVGAGYTGKADTYDEAMVVHEQVCARVRRCLAEYRQEQAEEAAAYQAWRAGRKRLGLPTW